MLVETSREARGSVERGSKTVGDCSRRLQASRFTRWSDLMICEKRLELVRNRPFHESSGDWLLEVEKSLESEHRTLCAIRERLMDMEEEMKSVADEYRGANDEISRAQSVSNSAILQGLREMRNDHSFVARRGLNQNMHLNSDTFTSAQEMVQH